MILGVDIGSSEIRIASRKNGIVARCSPFCLQDRSGNFLPTSPLLLEETELPGIVSVPALVEGRVHSVEAIHELFLRAFTPLGGFWKLGYPRWVVCSVAQNASELERRALRDGLSLAGAWKVRMVDKARSSWLGAASEGCPVLVDLGDHSTQAYCAYGDHCVQNEFLFGGHRLDLAIQTHMREQRGLELSLKQAESLKIQLATVLVPTHRTEIACLGRSCDGLAIRAQISNHEIHELLLPQLEKFADTLKNWLLQIPGQLLDSALNSGLILAGGTALLHDLPEFLSARLGMPVKVAERPRDSVALGCLMRGSK